MLQCAECKQEKPEELFNRDKFTKSGFTYKCKDCLRQARNKKNGYIAKKNINNLYDANEWLKVNFPKYQILTWGKKCKFYDTNRQKEFEMSFSQFKDSLRENPDTLFSPSKEEILAKQQETMLKKYGAQSALQVSSFKEKQKQTVIERYGVENPMHHPFVVQKVKNNWQAKDNQEYDSIFNKRKKTMIDLYGVEFPMQSKELQNIINDKSYKTKLSKGLIKSNNKGETIKELAQKKNLSYSQVSQTVAKFGFEIAEKLHKKNTDIEISIQNILQNNKNKFLHGKMLSCAEKRYYPDFLIEDKKLIIECDGLYWHSDKFLDNAYHQRKKSFYTTLGYSSLFFREDEILEKFQIVESIIKNKLGVNQKIGARKTTVSQENALDFLEQNHLMGKGSGRCYVLRNKDEIVACLQVRWKDKNQNLLDISRFCTKNGVSVVGGFTKLLNHVINTEHPHKIMTFIDKRYGDGSYLENFGFKKESEYLSFKWVKGSKSFHRLNFPGNTGYQNGLFKIWDCGQAKYVLNLKLEHNINGY